MKNSDNNERRFPMLVLKTITVLPTLMRWRIETIRNVYGIEPEPRLLVAIRRYYREHVADGSHVAFVAEADGEECGCGAISFTEELPSPDNPTGRCAYITNIYVREAYRNKGIERDIVSLLMEEAESRGVGKIFF